MVNWAAPQNRGFGELDLYRWICTAGFVQLDVQMLYSIKYCVQAGIGWYRLDLPSVGPRGSNLQSESVTKKSCAGRAELSELASDVLPKILTGKSYMYLRFSLDCDVPEDHRSLCC